MKRRNIYDKAEHSLTIAPLVDKIGLNQKARQPSCDTDRLTGVVSGRVADANYIIQEWAVIVISTISVHIMCGFYELDEKWKCPERAK
jgi:hypothetical protein